MRVIIHDVVINAVINARVQRKERGDEPNRSAYIDDTRLFSGGKLLSSSSCRFLPRGLGVKYKGASESSSVGVKGPREEEEPVEKSDVMPPSHVAMLDVVDWVES